ncbi:uncharacterized protein TRAVEDRAFT_74164 [Trametes versicolor FP-101664 SS1]|uniref:uncharacterized protein n=1 Tax=Trametes versicolor (strain FP-101664) TaxID=717944 RepID=UPI0004624256|nr:uncharacterized protein TRAVEDRAFT_74164 [Trametes versicolor FP-101664 SS1]EIW55299.1 hypothetical protein TRAVEDRAFT_74164 [Trametes versicolor FP-101664 SS1]
MSTPSRVDTPNTGALGFLSRGIRSVSSFVSTMFSSQAAEVSAHDVPADESAPATPRASQASDDLAHSGSSSSEDIDNSAPALDDPTSEDDAHSVSSQEEQSVGPDVLATRALEMASVAGPSNTSSSGMLVVPASSSADLNPDPDNPPRPAPSAAAVLYRQRAPLRREGAFYGLPGPSSTANEASTSSAPAPPPRPRGQLRREPVWHDGEDPSTVAPASELRGRDPRTIPENRYWHPRWGPIPTLRQIHPGPGTPSARDVIAWLQQRYGTSSNAFWQAVDHVFPLPDGVDHAPLFARILETSQWRNQDPNWMDGVEPVERVREPARADDAADSDADAESVGYFSDDDAMVEDAEDTTAAPQAGPSSLALVPFRSSSRAPSRASSVHSSPVHSSSALPASSPGAGASTQSPGHLKRARDSNGDASDEERSTPRRRLDPEPQQSPAASSSSSSATSRRITRSASHFSRRGASFAPAPVAGPSRPAPAPRAPQITVTPPSRDVSFTLPRPPTEGYLAPGVGRGMRRRRSSSSSSRGSSRSSPSSSSSSQTILRPLSTAAESSTSTPGAGPSSLRGPSSPGPSGESAQRRHKRRRDEAEAEDKGRSDDKRPPEDEGSSRKRPKRK